MTQETRAAAATNLRRIARRVMDNMMGDLDLVLSNSDATLVHYASCAGWPVAGVPLGRVPRNGQPYGMFAMARHGREDLLLRFTRAWDGQFGRCAPPVMVME
jgi:amidase